MKVGYVITEVDEYDVKHRLRLMYYDGVRFYLDDTCEEELRDMNTVFSFLYRVRSNTVWYVHPAWDEGVEQISYEDMVDMIENSADPDTVWDHAFYDLVRMDRNRRRKE